MLVAARLRHVASTRWGTKRYLDPQRLWEQEQVETTALPEGFAAATGVA